MNEQNAISQLRLTREISQARQMQLVALDQALMRLNCAASSRECRIFAALSIFLTYLANRLETLIAAETTAAFRALEEMKQLPDQAQWEYRIAHTLGLAEGLNRAGSVQAKIIEQAQASLHKASMLLMVQAGDNQLPVKIKSRQDYIQTLMQEVNPKQDKRMGTANQLALQLSKAYLRRATEAQEAIELTIATSCVAALDSTLAALVSALCTVAYQAIQSGKYIDDPAGGASAEEFHTARLLAAGIVSVMVTDLLKQNAPWISVNLN